jgi:predicted DsbA family dithiol-disulfide isomerase
VERLGLDLERFERDRRSDAVAERVERDFRSGIRAGVTTTPTLFVEGEMHAGVPDEGLLARLRSGIGSPEAHC